jgi:hypothetical protein
MSDSYTSDDISTVSYQDTDVYFKDSYSDEFDIRESGSNSFKTTGKRETELRRKIQRHSCKNIQDIPVGYKPSIYSDDGIYISEKRKNIRKPEDNYHAGHQISGNQTRRPPVQKEEFYNKSIEGHGPTNSYSTEIQNKHLQKQNDTLIMFVFFLLVVVIIQYNRATAQPVRLMIVPGQHSESTPTTLTNTKGELSDLQPTYS